MEILLSDLNSVTVKDLDEDELYRLSMLVDMELERRKRGAVLDALTQAGGSLMAKDQGSSM